MVWHDDWAVTCLAALAVWILLSGADDLFISLLYLLFRKSQPAWPSEAELDQAPERRIAVLVPLWKEHRVIGQMLARNLSVIRYRNYDVFVGVYPNDQPTLRAVEEAAASHSRVHVAVCPHDGPTSKGDCLNWIYRAMEQYEARQGIRFDVVTTHDAEDLIHPDSFRLINWFSPAYDMVQIPVLPLPTRPGESIHGLYCDEFAEYQQKDIPVRQILQGFLPANGVGTGFGRIALDRLAAARRGRVFDPECLTEDYESGLLLHDMGYSQIFVPLRFGPGGPVATREYFPRKLPSAIRQRCRWVTGIALQGWEHHAWRGSWRQRYWFWRDRKGLVGNLLSPIATTVFLYGVAKWIWAAWNGSPAGVLLTLPSWLTRAYELTLMIALFQAALRMWLSSRVYGWRFAAAGPWRMIWGNLINSTATVAAVWQYLGARLARRTPAWLKTDHVYPAPVAAERGRARLGEVLVKMRSVSLTDVEEALTSRPAGRRLGEHLVELRKISEDGLYQALSFQAGIPLGAPSETEVSRLATRVLPAEEARRWKVMPYRVSVGQLHVLTPEVPSEAMAEKLAALSNLEIRFHLVKPGEFEAMAVRYLPRPVSGVRVPA